MWPIVAKMDAAHELFNKSNNCAPAGSAIGRFRLRAMTYRFGLFELDEERFELRRSGRRLAVQRKVLEALLYLVKHRERLVSKDELMKGPWNGTVVTDGALSQVIMLAR